MKRRLLLLSCCGVLGLCAVLPAIGQSPANSSKPSLPKLRAIFPVKPLQMPAQSAAITANTNASTSNALPNFSSVPLFTYTVTSSRDGNSYSGFIVGSSPFDHGNRRTDVPTEIIPVIVVTHSVATGLDQQGIFSSAPGETKFNPTTADNSCLVRPNNVALRLVQQSPIIQTADFNFGGTDVGRTQAIDAFQRANFWSEIGHNYHVLLNPVHTLPPITMSFDAADSLSLPPSLFGACGPLGIIDINVLDDRLVNEIIPSLASRGVRPSNFPIFVFYNVGFSIGSPLNIGNCCALGYHSAFLTADGKVQTYSPSEFDSTGLFGSDAEDTATLSHEVGEWMDDPFGFNPTPPWGHTGQVGGCQDNLEVGDPLTGNTAPRIFMPNGFTYHLQELAFFSWFYGAPSTGIHGWFSDNATFLTDAGAPCVSPPPPGS